MKRRPDLLDLLRATVRPAYVSVSSLRCEARQKIQSWGGQISVDWSINDTLQLKNITAIRNTLTS